MLINTHTLDCASFVNQLSVTVTRHVHLLSGLANSCLIEYRACVRERESSDLPARWCRAVTKIWKFNVSRITDYTSKSIEADLIQLLPDIAQKGLKL